MSFIRRLKSFLKSFFILIYDLFTEHPRSVGESYLCHMLISMKMSILSLVASVIFLIHSVFPFLFKKTGCDIVVELDYNCSRNGPCNKDNSESPFDDIF